MASLAIARSAEVTGCERLTTRSGWHRVRDAVAVSVRSHLWGLEFRQSSFRLITRVLRDGTVSVFEWLPLFGHAVVPSGFRLQVNPMTQKHPSELPLIASGIQHRVPRRTLSRSYGSSNGQS